jgi:hypothetical protein
MRSIVNKLGRGLGIVCGAFLSAAWALAVWVPAAGVSVTGVSVIVALLFTVLALLAVIASIHGHFTVVTLLFIASFFPVGMSLLPVQHWPRFIGWADLGLLAAAVLMWSTRGSARGAPPQPLRD